MKIVSTQLILNKAVLNQQDPEGREHRYLIVIVNIANKSGENVGYRLS